MYVAPTRPAASPEPPVEVTTRASRAWRGHLVFAVFALLVSWWVTQRLWSGPYSHVIAQNTGDQAFYEWVLAYGVEVMRHGYDPFFTHLMNAPNGVNLAANTSILVDAVVFAPVTVFAGPQVSFIAILTLNLAGSAFAWYLFLRRYLVRHWLAAGIGALLCGFGPGFVAHANGHLNWTSGWIAPLIIWAVIKLRQPGQWLLRGLVLGVILAVSFSIAAEALFFVALATAVFVVTWSLSPATRGEARAAAPTVLRGLVVAAVVAGSLLAYPLLMHFTGPQTFGGTGFNQRHYSEDLAAYIGYSSRTLAGRFGFNGAWLAPNKTEETSFLGLPLVLLVPCALVMLWRRGDPRRRATLAALTAVIIVFFVLSLGPRLHILKHETPIVLPYAALARLPLFNSALPLRMSLVVTCAVGIVLALTVDRLWPRPNAWTQGAWAAGLVLALVPLIPLPLLVTERTPEPAFIAEGLWQQYVPPGGTMSAIPFANNVTPDAQRWQAYTLARGGAQFQMPAGYFLGPGGKDGVGRVGVSLRHTDWLFYRAAVYGYVRPIDGYDREQARKDFAFWNLDAIFLPDRIKGQYGLLFHKAVEYVATGLLGPPQRVGGVLVWRIRPGVDPITVSGR